MKLCKDCFYCQKYDLSGDIKPSIDWRCSQVLNVNPVDGSKTFALCSVERDKMAGLCGYEGKLYANRKEREREINYDGFPKEVDSNDDWEFSRG